MDLTARLKKWLTENIGVKANADEESFRKAAGEAIATGDLSLLKLKELTSTKEDEEADEFTSLVKGLGESLAELRDVLLEDEQAVVRTKSKKEEKFDDEEEEEDDEDMEDEEKMEDEDEEEEEEKGKKKSFSKTKGMDQPSELEKMVSRMSFGTLHVDDEEKSFDLRVKEAAEQYDGTKSAMVYPSHNQKGKPHALAGRPVMDYTEAGMGRPIDNPSQLDKAVAGAFSKLMIASATRKSRNLGFLSLPDHDKELLYYAMQKCKWSGSSDGGDYADIKNRLLTPREQKALIDDATSGGLEAAPIVFDDQVITTPLLYGELFPLVNSVPLDRGRRVEGVATGNVTGSWGGVDDTEISLFNTASYVTAFDTTIFRWEGAVRIGLDFLSDTPIDFGAHFTTQYGERLLEDLDDVVATGNGTTQPEGVMNKSGATSVAWGGTTSLGNYESLRFGVTKAEHRSTVAATAVFCGNETSYMRARALPVGASDARRLGGSMATMGGVVNYSDYQWMGTPYKINESMANTQVFYAIMARYRMYRRRGLTIRTTTEGDTLMRRNEMLIIAMARYGGQMERGAVIARTTTAPA